MKSYLQDIVEWLAQKLIIQASNRAVEMLEDADGKSAAPKALPAPKIREIELH